MPWCVGPLRPGTGRLRIGALCADHPVFPTTPARAVGGARSSCWRSRTTQTRRNVSSGGGTQTYFISSGVPRLCVALQVPTCSLIRLVQHPIHLICVTAHMCVCVRGGRTLPQPQTWTPKLHGLARKLGFAILAFSKKPRIKITLA